MTCSPPIAARPHLTNERKFVAHSTRAARGIKLLDLFLHPDGEYPSNTINSIYYETRDLRAFAEKADGDNLKHKVRLRWYSDSVRRADTAGITAYLEVKFRIGSARHKMRHALKLDAHWLNTTPLSDPKLRDVLLLASPELGEWMSNALLPAIHISYERHRYRCPYTDGRVAVDQNIQVHRFHPELFPLGVPLRIDDTVCEFKDAAQVDIPWLWHMNEAGFQMRSYSKFGEAIRLLFLGGAPA